MKGVDSFSFLNFTNQYDLFVNDSDLTYTSENEVSIVLIIGNVLQN